MTIDIDDVTGRWHLAAPCTEGCTQVVTVLLGGCEVDIHPTAPNDRPPIWCAEPDCMRTYRHRGAHDDNEGRYWVTQGPADDPAYWPDADEVTFTEERP